MSHIDHESNMHLENRWIELEESRKALLSGEATKTVTAEFFNKEKNCACCIDERVGNRATLGGKDVGGRWNVAGSGILLPVEKWQDRAKVAAEEAFERGVTTLTFHDGCGAAGLAVKQDLGQFDDKEKELYVYNSDLYGQKFVELAQEELNKLFKQSISAIHVPKVEVAPFEYHSAIGATIDTTGEFNAYALPVDHPLRESFNIDTSSGNKLKIEESDLSYYLNEVLVAISIATGHHGFGKKFNKENPFALTVIGTSREEVQKVKRDIVSFLKDKKPEFLEVVQFVELVKPESKKHPSAKPTMPEVQA